APDQEGTGDSQHQADGGQSHHDPAGDHARRHLSRGALLVPLFGTLGRQPRRQNSPSISPSSRRWIASADGTRGRPGIVMMSPQIATTNPAPADSRTSRTGSVKPSGAPMTDGSAVKLYCVLAMHTGTWPKPAFSKPSRRRATASLISRSPAR